MAGLGLANPETSRRACVESPRLPQAIWSVAQRIRREWDRGVEGFVLRGDRVLKSKLMGFAAAHLDRSSQRTGSHPAGGPPLGGAAELSLVRLAPEKVEMTSV